MKPLKQMMFIANREVKLGYRNPWAYSFMALFVLFMLSLLLINTQGYMEGFSGLTSTMLQLILYLLPLMTLMLGSFSLTTEKEDGNWQLLSTYPLRTLSYIAGKYFGLMTVMAMIIASGFGVSALVSVLTGSTWDLYTYSILLFFALVLSLMFLAIAMLLGAMSRNRWQALTICVAVWFFMIVSWGPLLIAFLGFLPVMWVKPALSTLTLFNPAELARLFAVIQLGGGSAFGPDYYTWVKWIRQPYGMAGFIGAVFVWIALCVSAAISLWERSRRRG